MRRMLIVTTAILLAGCAETVVDDDVAAENIVEQPSYYHASGNEPFWNIDITDNQLRLNRLGEEEQSFTLGSAEPIAGGLSRVGEGIQVAMINGQCTDTMSGIRRAHRVTVKLGEDVLNGCGGNMVVPEALAETEWTLLSLDGKDIALDPAPSLAVANDGRVAGSDGCNRFMGGLAFGPEGRAASEGQGASTMMACQPEREEVARNYNALRATVNGWKIDQGNLVLTTSAGQELIFKPAV